jgi:membrane-associated protease RseP (regulator of RpoE activity)
MKWVVGVVAVLVALVVGVAIGWTLRGRSEPLHAHHVYTPAPPPPPLPPAPVTVTAPPPVTIVKPPGVWAEDTDAFAWPSTASDDVVVVDATHYLVKRAWMTRVTANNELTSLRVLPSHVDGGVMGVKVFGIRVGSAAAKIGLQNGDTLETLDGLALAAPEQALEAYTKTHDAKKLVLGIERKGAHLDMHYRVID